MGGEPGHEPGREPERRPGCGFGTELWRDLLPLLENCQMANTLTQVPEGARFTLEAERVKPKDTMPRDGGGKRRFLVDTFAGFALAYAPDFDHLRTFANLGVDEWRRCRQPGSRPLE